MGDMGLGFEVAEPNVMKRPPQSLKAGIFTWQIMIDMVVYGVWTAALCLAAFVLVLYGFGNGNLGENCNEDLEGCETVFLPHATRLQEVLHPMVLGHLAQQVPVLGRYLRSRDDVPAALHPRYQRLRLQAHRYQLGMGRRLHRGLPLVLWRRVLQVDQAYRPPPPGHEGRHRGLRGPRGPCLLPLLHRLL